MSRILDVHLLPALVEPSAFAGGIAVMIDVLRASTTMIHALDAGARAVIPCQEVDEARLIASNYSRSARLLGGERNGELIEGFDLNNSPLAYTEARVKDQTIVFTTTNGTRALSRAREADSVLIGAFVNLNAVVARLVAASRPIHLVCAGTNGRVSAEDVLCAGAMALGFQRAVGTFDSADDQASLSINAYRANSECQQSFLSAIRESVGGRNLRRLGYDDDIRCAASWDRFRIVPKYHQQTGLIDSPAIAEPDETTWVTPPEES